MDNPKLVRPGDTRVPCIAILGFFSGLQLVNLEGGNSSSVKISDHSSLGIVANNGEVFAVTEKEILKLRSDGTREYLSALPEFYECSWVVLFQKKIYIIQPHGMRMLCFDPADNSLNDLPGCGWIGLGTETRSMKFDPLKLKWKKKARMRKKRVGAAAATLDGKIYVMGDRDYRTGISVECYNPGNNSWTEISNMNAGRHHFRACVDGDRLYAVGGDGELEWKNGFPQQYQHSIEVYDKNKWTVVTKFQAKGEQTYSCFWPHGPHQPDSTLPKNLPDLLENMYSLLKSEDLLEAKTKIGSKEEKFNYPGLKFKLPEGILKEEKEVTLSARVGVDQKEGMPDITPTYECNPPVTFEKPVSMTMRTSISAPAGKEIRVSLFTRVHPGDEWKEMQQLSLGPRNEVDFEILHFGGIKVASGNTDVKLHSITGFNIHLETGMTTVTFSKDQAVHEAVKKSMHENGFVNFAVIPHDILAKYGSEISVSMERKEPKDTTTCTAYPSASFQLDEDYLQKGKHIVYFKFDPEPSDQCRTISMEYGYKVNGEPEGKLPLTTKWPRTDPKKDMRSHSNVTNITYNITGDAPTVVNAPVGQLAAGNANITNQGAGNNFVAGSQENTDRSVTAGKALYGQSTSSSVGENITVHRSGT